MNRLLCALLLLISLPGFSQDKKKMIDSLEDVTVDQYAKKQYRKVLSAIDEILEIIPCSKRHMNNAYVIALELKDTAATIRYLEKLVECDDEDPASLSILGWMLTTQKQPAKGLAYCKKGYEVLPGDIGTRVNYAHCLWLTNQKAEARKFYRNAINIMTTRDRLKDGLMEDLKFLAKAYPKAGFAALITELNTYANTTFLNYKKGNDLQAELNNMIAEEMFGDIDQAKYIAMHGKIIKAEKAFPVKRYELIAAAYAAQSKLYYSSGDFEKAISGYKTAIQYNILANNIADKVSNQSNIAMVYSYMGLPDSAYDWYLDALTTSKATGYDMLFANTAMTVGMYLNEIGDDASAIQAYNVAEERFASHNNFASLAELYYHMGNVYSNTYERIDSGGLFYEKARNIAELYGASEHLHKIYYGLANMEVYHSNYPLALMYLQKTLELGEFELKNGNPVEYIELLSGLGFVLAKLNKYDSAIYYLEQATSRSLAIRRQLSERAKLEYHAKMIGPFETLVNCYLAIDDKNKALQTMEKAKNMQLAEKMQLNPEETFSIDSIRNKMRDDQVYLVYGNMNSDGRIDTKSFIAFSKTGIAASILSDSMFIEEAAKNSYGAKLDTVINEFKKYRRNKIQDQLIGKELRLFTMIYRNALSEAAGQKRSSIKAKDDITTTAQGQFSEPLAHLLYRQFFKPIEQIAKDKKELIILSDGDLNFVPFESLQNDEGKYLGDLYTIKYLPSLKVGKGLEKRRAHDTLRISAFGNPMYENLSAEGKTMTPVREYYSSIDAQWARLPGTEKEIDSIAGMFNNSVTFRQDESSETMFKTMETIGGFTKCSVLHFATHGYVSNDIPAYSALVLNQTDDEAEDGYLTAQEIEHMNIPTDLVVLSACQTGLGLVKQGEGVQGMAGAFFVAGTKSIIVSMWSVSDDATAKFMINMYREVKENGVDFKTAMHRTRQRFINGDFGQEYRKPYYWAPFVYYGN